MNFIKSAELRKRAHQLIPGGCHTYAKGDDQYPKLSPGFIVKGKGCHRAKGATGGYQPLVLKRGSPVQVRRCPATVIRLVRKARSTTQIPFSTDLEARRWSDVNRKSTTSCLSDRRFLFKNLEFNCNCSAGGEWKFRSTPQISTHSSRPGWKNT